MKVKDCMCDGVYSVKPDTQITEVAKIMGENHIGCVPVCDKNDALCGIITDRDIILRAVACKKDTCQTQASDIMTTNVCSCKQEDDMSAAQAKMSENQIRRLPVCDDNNHVVGMLSLGDLAQNDSSLGKNEVATTINRICDCNENKNAE